MVLSPHTIQFLGLLKPCLHSGTFMGVSYGLGHAGYDLRVAEDHIMLPGDFCLASAIEEFTMPDTVGGIIYNKSTWARRGLSVFNTVVEPGWQGCLTMELANHGRETLYIKKGMGLAQVIFYFLDRPTDNPYQGKYQGQKPGPQEAIFEEGT